MKVASTKLTNPEWETLQAKCNEHGMSIAEYLRNLIRGDSMEKALPSEGVEDEKAPIVNAPISASNSGLSRLFETKISRDKEGEQLELKTEVGQMQELLQKQGLLIRNLSNQLTEVGNKVDAQNKRLVQRASQPSPVNGKMSCVFSDHAKSLNCYKPFPVILDKDCHQ